MMDSMRAGRFGVRTPVGAKDFFFSTPTQTGGRAHPVSYWEGTGAPPRGWNDNPSPSSAEVVLYTFKPSAPPVACYGANFTFTSLILSRPTVKHVMFLRQCNDK